MRLLVTVLVVGICAFPLTAVEPFSTVITSRVQSITNVQEDYSYQARAASYNRALGAAPFQYLGNGLGLPGLDSAFLDVILQMGWLGGIPYLGGLILILFKLSQCLRIRSDPFLIATTSICFATFGMLIFNNVFAGIQGVIFWSFIGISLAGHKYYYQQQRTASHREFLQLNPNR
jgi:O-antigen ligase